MAAAAAAGMELAALLPTRRLGVIGDDARVGEAERFKAHGNALVACERWSDALRNYCVALWLLGGGGGGRMPPQFLVAAGARAPSGERFAGLVHRGAALSGLGEAARGLRAKCLLNAALACVRVGDPASA